MAIKPWALNEYTYHLADAQMDGGLLEDLINRHDEYQDYLAAHEMVDMKQEYVPYVMSTQHLRYAIDITEFGITFTDPFELNTMQHQLKVLAGLAKSMIPSDHYYYDGYHRLACQQVAAGY